MAHELALPETWPNTSCVPAVQHAVFLLSCIAAKLTMVLHGLTVAMIFRLLADHTALLWRRQLCQVTGVPRTP